MIITNYCQEERHLGHFFSFSSSQSHNLLHHSREVDIYMGAPGVVVYRLREKHSDTYP